MRKSFICRRLCRELWNRWVVHPWRGIDRVRFWNWNWSLRKPRRCRARSCWYWRSATCKVDGRRVDILRSIMCAALPVLIRNVKSKTRSTWSLSQLIDTIDGGWRYYHLRLLWYVITVDGDFSEGCVWIEPCKLYNKCHSSGSFLIEQYVNDFPCFALSRMSRFWYNDSFATPRVPYIFFKPFMDNCGLRGKLKRLFCRTEAVDMKIKQLQTC